MTYEPIWGSIIAWYLFLAGLGGGAFVTAVFIRFRHPACARLVRIGRIIAPTVVIVGLCLLMFDAAAGFAHPLRFALLLTNFGSVMTWGVVFLAAFVIVALIVLALDLLKRAVPEWLDIAGMVLGLCVAVYTGCLLGVCQGFPLWNTALLPILFLVSAVSTGMAAVLLAGVFAAPDEFNAVVVLKKFHFWLPVVELVLVAALLFVTAANPSSAGWESVMTLIAGRWAVCFWLLFVVVGLVLPTVLECWMLWIASHELETSRTGQMVSALSDAGVLIGGFVLRLMIVSAALPITIVQPWLLSGNSDRRLPAGRSRRVL